MLSVAFEWQHPEPLLTSAMQTGECWISNGLGEHLVGGLTCYGEVIQRVGQVGVQRFLFVADERAVCLQQEVARSPVLYVFTWNEMGKGGMRVRGLQLFTVWRIVTLVQLRVE